MEAIKKLEVELSAEGKTVAEAKIQRVPLLGRCTFTIIIYNKNDDTQLHTY